MLPEYIFIHFKKLINGLEAQNKSFDFNPYQGYDNVNVDVKNPINDLENCIDEFNVKSRNVHSYRMRRNKFFKEFIKENQEARKIFSKHEQTTYRSKKYSELASTLSGLDEMFERIHSYTNDKPSEYNSDLFFIKPEEKLELIQKIELEVGYQITLTSKGLKWLNKYRKTKKLKNLRPKKNGYFIKIPDDVLNKMLFG